MNHLYQANNWIEFIFDLENHSIKIDISKLSLFSQNRLYHINN